MIRGTIFQCLHTNTKQALQVPLLAIGTFSMMSLEHPALATEGCLWFPDLLKGALSWQGVWEVVSAGDVYITNEESEALRAAIAPMGLYGVILPTAFYLIWRDNLANAMLTVSSFFMRTFGQSTFESGVLKGRSRAQTGINRNVVRALPYYIAFVYLFPFESGATVHGALFSLYSSHYRCFSLRPGPRIGRTAEPEPCKVVIRVAV